MLGSPGSGEKKFEFVLPCRGEGKVSSRVGLEMGGWFCPLPRGTRQARKRGGGALGVNDVAGGK